VIFWILQLSLHGHLDAADDGVAYFGDDVEDRLAPRTAWKQFKRASGSACSRSSTPT
jgi:hypothetical protein